MRDEAMYGLAGRVVSTIEPHSEADPAALLLQFLAAIGNVVGRKTFTRVESTRHHLNLFVALVGETSKARKGTSWGHINSLFSAAEASVNGSSNWPTRLISGLASGEGLIQEVRDGVRDNNSNDVGVVDKRRIVIDSEFAATLKVLGRQGNTLSAVIRNAWDGQPLAVTTKNSPLRATEAHISIVGHITRDELRRELTSTESGNGFANRFLWCAVRRSKLLPDGGSLSPEEIHPLVVAIKDVVGASQNITELKRDTEAKQLWRNEYARLSTGQDGLLGAVTARGEAQVLRLSGLYAVLDQSNEIRREHLLAALAVWDFCEASARFIFSGAQGNPVADKILKELQTRTLTRTDIRDLLGRNAKNAQIEEALELLRSKNLASVKRVQSLGTKDVEVWNAV